MPPLQANAVYCGDCLELLPQLDDNSIDLVVTSPPYNIGVKYDSCNDEQPWSEYYKWCRKWIREIFRILKPDGRFCLNHYLSCGWTGHRSNPAMNLNAIAMEEGLQEHGVAVWDDRTLTKFSAWGSWMSAAAPYVNSPHECIILFYKDHWKKDRVGESTITGKEFMEACSGVWKIQPEQDRITPAPFPLALPLRCINLLSFKGDLVLDPFCGGGTTCLAAKVAGRDYIGFELSPHYSDIARQRLNQSTIEAWMLQAMRDENGQITAEVITQEVD